MSVQNLYGMMLLIRALSKDPGRISTATFVQSIVSIDNIWSNIGEIDKVSDEAVHINNMMKDLKMKFKLP